MIKVHQLSKHYTKEFPLHEVNYTFEAHRKYIITGPSGCGKTTLLRLIAGLESIDKGKIVKDEVIIGAPGYQLEPFKRKIGFVFQEPTLWPHMTVKNNITFASKNKKDLEKITSVMKIKHIMTKFPSEISGGEAKRVAIARMMILKWQYLLLDEPLANIDVDLKNDIIDFINQYVEENKTTLIYVTHNMQEAKKIEGERIIFS